MATKDLQLYVKDACPYCRRVESFMSKAGIELPLHDIDESDEDRAYLIEHGGKRQVPCLFVDGQALYESEDIIDFLSREFDVKPAGPAAGGESAAGGACSLDGSGCSF
ncbi:glutaredoxin [Olsenella sp. HMSC062G07]|uniref:glutaredoxin family protein n=1 Tax=Olsenella sp. HMSC062G07 TaxID=1739330 RepID=UPI0008A44991|nr:glutaredoxin [Olsenella sp. HMSC062G07]OFK23554.1 glutaredoxin [Olsenella sp. HMSC062G07]